MYFFPTFSFDTQAKIKSFLTMLAKRKLIRESIATQIVKQCMTLNT